jgi:hypothetical protein
MFRNRQTLNKILTVVAIVIIVTMVVLTIAPGIF